MARYRTWVSLLALFGVLLHAGFIVRHNTSMFSTTPGQALANAVGVICHAGTGSASSKSLPNVPDPRGKNYGCPICMGCISAVAVMPDMLTIPVAPDQISAQIAVIGKTIRYRMAAVCPPSRGPPALV